MDDYRNINNVFLDEYRLMTTKKTNTKKSTSKKGKPVNTRRPPVKLTPKLQAEFLQSLAQTGNVTLSAHKINMSRKHMYEYYKAVDKDGNFLHPAFRDAWDDAIEVSIDILEAEARRRAEEGIDKPVGFFQGVSQTTVKEYSDSLLMFLLRALRSKKYMDRREVHGEETVKLTVVIDEGKPNEKGNK